MQSNPRSVRDILTSSGTIHDQHNSQETFRSILYFYIKYFHLSDCFPFSYFEICCHLIARIISNDTTELYHCCITLLLALFYAVNQNITLYSDIKQRDIYVLVGMYKYYNGVFNIFMIFFTNLSQQDIQLSHDQIRERHYGRKSLKRYTIR